MILLGLVASLVPYFWLLSDRDPTTDASQILEQTRKLVFLRPTLIVGLLILCLTGLAIRSRRIELKHQTTIFIISLAILPLLVLNQQIITGYSLQPIHYDMYILNYLCLLALVLLVGEAFREELPRARPIVWLIASISFCIWGVVETNYTTQNRYAYNVKRDEAILVNRRLREIAGPDLDGAKQQITLNFESVQADSQPTVAPYGVVWSEHLAFAGNIAAEALKRRFFLFIYFQDRTVDWLEEQLRSCPNEACRALIGWRVNPRLSLESSRVEEAEVTALTAEYGGFVRNITASDALDPKISYLVIPNDAAPAHTNFEIWYEKGTSEQVGSFALYKVGPLAR